MRIGIDCRTILDETAREKAGVAHYTYYLVKNLLALGRQNEYVLFFNPSTSSGVIQEFYSLRKAQLSAGRVEGGGVEIRFFPSVKYKKFLPYVYSHLLLANQIRKARLDVFHSPANIVPLSLLTAKARPKIIVTIHDLAIYRHPEWFPPRQGFSIKYLVPKTIKLVDHIIVPSEATAEDLRELFAVSRKKITVIAHGVEERFFQNLKYEARSTKADPSPRASAKQATAYQLLTSDYILFVGTLEPRKNLMRLIEAYAGLPQDILEKYDLVLAGQPGWKYEETLRQIRMTNAKFPKEKIKVLGFYPGAQLPELMAKAAVFIYPSLYEGFGLPVLEAMAAGVPVVTSNVSSLPEIVSGNGFVLSSSRTVSSRQSQVGKQGPNLDSRLHGNDKQNELKGATASAAGVLVNPYSAQEIAEAIAKLIRDGVYSSQISQAGVHRAGFFTWQRCVEATVAVYRGNF